MESLTNQRSLAARVPGGALAWLATAGCAAGALAQAVADRPVGQEAAEPAASPELAAEGPFGRDRLLGDAGGIRLAAEGRGVVVEAGLVADFSQNLRGGADTEGAGFRHLFDLNVSLLSRPLLGYDGGTLFLDFQTKEGQDGSEEVRDFQAFSNLDAPDFTALYELWYEQVLLDARLRVKVGKVDANSEFAFADFGGEFLNSSTGFSPTILALPTYPNPAMSINAFVEPVEAFYAGLGVYDGAAQEGSALGRRGPSTFLGDPSDLFLIGEAGLRWALADARNGRLAIGGWRHTGAFERFNGGTESGTGGLYAVLEQRLWRADRESEGDDRGVGAFVQYGYADPGVSEAEHHVGAGVSASGVVPGRPEDALGAYGSLVLFSQGAGFTEDHELAVEAFYKAAITPWLSLKPDVQYIVNPGGDDALRDAVVATLRVEAAF